MYSLLSLQKVLEPDSDSQVKRWMVLSKANGAMLWGELVRLVWGSLARMVSSHSLTLRPLDWYPQKYVASINLNK